MQALFLLFWVLNVPYGIIEPLYTNRHRELLRESRGIPQIGERSNVTKSKKICRLTTRKRVDNLIYGRREKSQKPSKIKGLRHVSS